MRIGIIRDTIFTNEPRGQNIAKVLIALGHQVFVLCYGETNAVEMYQNMTLERFHLHPTIKRKFSSLIETIPLYKYLWAKKIKEFIVKYDLDVLQVHDLYMLGPAHIANKDFGLPIIANFHENYPAAVMAYNWAQSRLARLIARPGLWRKLEGEYLKNTQKVIVTCEEYREKLLEKYSFISPENVIVYINVPYLEEFSVYKIDEKVFTKNDSYVLFYFGVNAERRGLFTCFETLKILRDKIANVKLLLIGPVDNADKQRFDAYMQDTWIKNSVIFFPWKDINLIPSYIYLSDVCLSPLLNNEHHNTTIANKIFQYMLFEKPVIVSNCKPQQRIIEETGCGLVHQANSPKDLAQKVYKLYQNPGLSKVMGAKGKRAVFQIYNTKTQSEGVVKLYEDIEGRVVNHKQV